MRPLLLSALLCVFGVSAVTAELPPATGGQIAKMAAVARDGCLRHFPTYSGISDYLTGSGFARDKLGVWRDDATYVLVGQRGANGPAFCEVVMLYPVRTAQISDAVQAALPKAPVQLVKVTRHGVRIDAAFQKNGVPGRLQTAQARGRTAKITVTLED